MLVGTKVVGRRRAVWIAIGGIVLYTLLVDADAAVVRAAIMSGLFVLALYLGRQAEVRTSLIFAAILMTAANPLRPVGPGIMAQVRRHRGSHLADATPGMVGGVGQIWYT